MGEDSDSDEAVLREVKSKGYYHGRLHSVPSAAAPSPQRIDSPNSPISPTSPQRIEPTEGVSRRRVDAFQAKWDKWDDDKFVEAASKTSVAQNIEKQNKDASASEAKAKQEVKTSSDGPVDMGNPFSSSGEEDSFEKYCWLAVGTTLALLFILAKIS
jgi:hypothetical protein